MLTWQTLLFLLPLMVAALLVLVMAFGGADLDADVDLDVDAEAEAEIASSPLSLLGVGRAPLGLVLLCFLAVFGGSGASILIALGGLTAPTTSATLVAAAVAFAVAVLSTRWLATSVARAIPTVETYAPRPEDFVGRSGMVEVPATPNFGVVRVTDDSGTIHQLRCRADAEHLERGAIVLVIAHDPETGLFTVDRSPL